MSLLGRHSILEGYYFSHALPERPFMAVGSTDRC